MTSKLLSAEGDYLRLLLTTPNKTQAIALLDTATGSQLDLLAEIAHNLLTLPLPQAVAENVLENGKRGLLEKIADKSLSKRRRSVLVSRHCKRLLDIFLTVKSYLIRATK